MHQIAVQIYPRTVPMKNTKGKLFKIYILAVWIDLIVILIVLRHKFHAYFNNDLKQFNIIFEGFNFRIQILVETTIQISKIIREKLA